MRGLSPIEPGYRRVLIAPRPGGGITAAETTLETPHGRVSVYWVIRHGLLNLRVELPEGVEGTVRLPGGPDQSIGAGVSRAVAPMQEALAAR